MDSLEVKFNVELLGDIVKIISLNKLKYKRYLSEILELTIMSDKFYTITNSDSEFSLICNKELFEERKDNFDNYDIQIDSNEYNIYQFHEGGTGLEHTGIVERLSKIFSKDNIPIIYINSFNNNFILIDCKYRKKVINTLKKLNILI